jgi:hypothetical protein
MKKPALKPVYLSQYGGWFGLFHNIISAIANGTMPAAHPIASQSKTPLMPVMLPPLYYIHLLDI